MQTVPDRLRVLFLCTASSSRSQMAQGWAAQLRGDVLVSCAAGMESRPLDVHAVKVMAEVGVDLVGQRCRSFEEIDGEDFDVVVTFGDHGGDAAQRDAAAPFVARGARHVLAEIDCPARLAAKDRTEDEVLIHYRRVRNQLRSWIEAMPLTLEGAAAAE